MAIREKPFPLIYDGDLGSCLTERMEIEVSHVGSPTNWGPIKPLNTEAQLRSYG